MRAAHAAVAWLCAALIALPPMAQAAGGAYAVSGKRGPFIDQIAGRKLNAAGGQGARGLADDAINQGVNQAARLPMPHTEARIAELLARIEAGWPYAKGQPLKVLIQGVDYYSAYSLPDGSIVVGFGLLDRAQSDDEVAFVLAHELSHLRLGHFAAETARRKRRGGGERLGQLYVLASIAGGARDLRGGRQGAATLAGRASSAGRRAEATSDLLHFFNSAMIEPDWSQGEEDEADVLGFDLSLKAPFAAEAASARVFDTIQADEVRRRQVGAALQSRLKREMGRTATDSAIQSALNSRGSRQEFKRGLVDSAGRMALGAATRTEGGAEHRPPEDRKKGLGAYSAAAYRDLALRDETSVWLTELRASPEFADARVVVAAVTQAKTLRADGDSAAAETELAKASQTAFRDTPLVLNEAGRLRGDLGDTAGADALFNRAHASPNQTIDGYVDHVRMFYETGQGLNGFLVAKAGEDRFGDEKPFLALKIAIARQAKRKKEMNAFLKRCMKQDDEALQQDCQLAAGKTPEPRRRRGIQVMGVGLG